jgi:hypothetical protein
MGDEQLNGRAVHHWSGTDRAKDIEALCETIRSAIPALCTRDGQLAMFKDGALSPVNLATLRALLDQRIAAERVVPRNGAWVREYFTYQYAITPKWRWDGRGAEPQPPPETEPDAAALDTIYRTELAKHLPRVVE